MVADQALTERKSMQIGVALPITERADGDIASYAEIRALAQQAEAIGVDSIWLFDHLFFRRPDQPTTGIWECWSMLSALAEATERVKLGTLVLCTPFRNPAVLAKMADTVDAISNGRLILGLGAGWHEPEFTAFGVPFDHLVDRFEEALQIIVPLLRTGEVNFEGRYYNAHNCELRPRGPRANGPEILIGASKPRMLRLIARYADSFNTCWHGQAGVIATPVANLLAACSDVGRDPATLNVTVGVNIAHLPADTPPDKLPNPDQMLYGSAEDVAAGLRGYAERDVAHVICNLSPMNAETLGWFDEVLKIYRDTVGKDVAA